MISAIKQFFANRKKYREVQEEIDRAHKICPLCQHLIYEEGDYLGFRFHCHRCEFRIADYKYNDRVLICLYKSKPLSIIISGFRGGNDEKYIEYYDMYNGLYLDSSKSIVKIDYNLPNFSIKAIVEKAKLFSTFK